MTTVVSGYQLSSYSKVISDAASRRLDQQVAARAAGNLGVSWPRMNSGNCGLSATLSRHNKALKESPAQVNSARGIFFKGRSPRRQPGNAENEEFVWTWRATKLTGGDH